MSAVDPVVRLLAGLDRPASPTVEFQDALLARLLVELEGADQREPEPQVPDHIHARGSSIPRPLRRRPMRIALAIAVVGGAAVAALFVSSPWRTAPGFSLEEVQAAITPPKGTILHARWNITRTSQDYGCAVTLGPNELWADLSLPYTYREIDSVWPSADAVDRRSAACDKNASVTTERGGTPGTAFRFEPPDKLLPAGPGWTGGSMDEVARLREALADGTARDDGQVELDGRIVERIRVDMDPGPRSVPRYYYVDRETFVPVRVEDPGGAYFETPGLGPMRFDIVQNYLAYEFLPRTDANLALTDIWEQHPDAVGSPRPAPIRGLPTLTGAVAKTVRVAKGVTSAPVTFDVAATDDKGVEIPVSCEPRSGSRFPLGETFVFCEATDSDGNTNTAEFTVTVKQ